MISSKAAMEAACLLSLLSNGLGFTIPSSNTNLKPSSTTTIVLSMGYLDDISPSQPADNNTNKSKPSKPPNNPSGGRLVPSGRGPLGSYLDAVCSGTTGSSNNDQDDNNDDDDESEPIASSRQPKPASWANSYLTNFLTDDDPRTDIRNLLTQRSIQSFMRLLEECRDPHSAKWIQEDFLQTGNLLDYHGTGAAFIQKFGGQWDTPLLTLIAQPPDRLTISAKRRGRGHGGWTKYNPYLEERWMEMRIDIDPPGLAGRILEVREQLAGEWRGDLDVLIEANGEILESFFDTVRDRRDKGGDGVVGGGMEDWSFVRTAATLMNDRSRFAVTISSPFRRSNFDLMYNLCTQAAIHRILRERKAAHEEREVSYIFLRDFYTGRAEEYFDGDLQSGRADDFMDDLLQTSPSILSIDGELAGLVDPVGAAEDIIKMRKVVAEEWKLMMEVVSEEHTGLRQALLTKRMDVSLKQDDDGTSAGFE